MLALLLMLATAIFRLGSGVISTSVLEQEAKLAAELAGLLQAGESRGYVGVLKRYQAGAVLSVQVLNGRGELLAEWPPAAVAPRWGAAAPLLEVLRAGAVAVLAQRREIPLAVNDGQSGSLLVYGLRGVYGQPPRWWLDLILILGGIAGLVALRFQPRSADRTALVNRPQATSRTEQVVGRLGAMLDRAGVGIVLLNARSELRYLNGAAEKLSGWPRREALNLPAREVLQLASGMDPARDALDIPDAVAQERALNLRLQCRRGEDRAVQVWRLPLCRGHGNPVGMLILLRGLAESRPVEVSRWEPRLASLAIEGLEEGLLLTDKLGRILRSNRCLNRLFSYGEGELEGMSIAKLLPVPFMNEPGVRLQDYIGKAAVRRPQAVGWRKNASTFPAGLRVMELDADEAAYLVLISDCGEQLRQDNASMRLGRLLDDAAEEIYIFDAHSLYLSEANRQAREQLGYSLEQLQRMTPLHLMPDLDHRQFEHDLNALRNGELRQVVYRKQHLRQDGSRYPVAVRLSYSQEEEPPVFMALAQDITEQQKAEQQLAFLVHHDGLTGLPNRLALNERLQAWLADATDPGRICVLFIDLDNFKTINDHYGHSIGDEVLVEVGARLRASLPAEYFVAHLSGDEFVALAMQQETQQVEWQARRLLQAMEAGFRHGDQVLQIRLSIGVAWNLGNDSVKTLIQRADRAMYEAKNQGGAAYRCATEQATG